MSSEWKEVCLNEVGEIVTGKTPPSSVENAFADDGIPFITPKDMSGARFVERAERHLSKVGLTSVKSNVVPADSVAVSCIGSDMGKSILLKSESVTNQQINTIVVDQTKFDPRFIYYVLSTKQQELKNLASGSATPILNKGHFGKVVINTPLIANQKAITSILDPLDSKIELNRKTNQTLEQIAQALFKSWFVDFEPTRAKITAKEAGASPEEIERAAMCAISGQTPDQLAQLPQETQQNLKTTAALFPNALVDSELGEIPEGWEIKAIGHYLDTISKTYPLKTVDKVIFLNTGDIQNGQFLHAEYSEASSLPGQAKKSIQKNDILYSEIRPENKRFAFVNFDAPHHVVSTKLMVLRATKDISSLFLYFILTHQSTVDHLQMLAESRSGTFPQITFDHLSRIEFIAPFDNLLINKFVETVLEPSFQTQKMRDAENACLIELRDSLLPKLLSGEIQLKKNEETINV